MEWMCAVKFRSNLIANKSLFIRATGKANGSVTYTELEIEKLAIFRVV